MLNRGFLKSLFRDSPRRAAAKERRKLSVESLELRRMLTAVPYGATEFDLGEFMLGTVAVTPVFFESNGEIDPSTEDWDQAHINEVLGKIDEGLDWWVDLLATKSSIHELEFQVDTTFASTPVPSRYEGISRRSNDYSLYVTEFLASQGHASGNLELDMRAFNHAQREKQNTDWSFTIFVVPSVNDEDGQFMAGGSFSRAFAFAGGLHMVVPSTRPASTIAHETGHIFWGRDEYLGGGNYLQRRGYYNTQNLNAHDNPAEGFVQQPSIMASGQLLNLAYGNYVSPDSTLAMIGWQDSDGDGIFDVMDVPHRLTGTGYFQPGSSTYRFVGTAEVQTLPNLNPSGLRNDITLNRIREIEYRFDDGPWQVHSLPDAYEVNLDLSISVPGGVTDIEIRARDSKTTVSSNVFQGRIERADSTLVPGINGFSWIDTNKNGLRDVGEYGQAFWQVDVLDSSGNPLNLRKRIEPDDYPDGQLLSGFSPDVALNAVGTDTDGRVGVFPDSTTSTGNKNFRAYSKVTRSYQSNFNHLSRRLQATFNSPTSVVSIDAIGTSSSSYGRIEAFNISGQLLGRYTTDQLTSGQVETMTIARGSSDIAYVIIGGHAGSTVRLDNLLFGPETTTLTDTMGSYSFPSLPAGDYTVRMMPATGYLASDPLSSEQVVSVSTNAATVDVDFGFVTSTSPWQNQTNVHDVNGDTVVSALDVLLIVNELNENGARSLIGSGVSSPPFIDVSGDSFVSALDVLLVVNHINQNGAGEGESSAGNFSGSGSPHLNSGLANGGQSNQDSDSALVGEGESGTRLTDQGPQSSLLDRGNVWQSAADAAIASLLDGGTSAQGHGLEPAWEQDAFPIDFEDRLRNPQ